MLSDQDSDTVLPEARGGWVPPPPWPLHPEVQRGSKSDLMGRNYVLHYINTIRMISGISLEGGMQNMVFAKSLYVHVKSLYVHTNNFMSLRE